jgi:hypothetical protein
MLRASTALRSNLSKGMAFLHLFEFLCEIADECVNSSLAALHSLQDATHLLISIPPVPGMGDPVSCKLIVLSHVSSTLFGGYRNMIVVLCMCSYLT